MSNRSRFPGATSSLFQLPCLGLSSSLVLGISRDTPQENTDSSATRLGPYANEGTGSSGLMELLHPDTLMRLHLFCRQPSRSGDTPQENTDSSATRLGPHANEGTGTGRLLELCTHTLTRALHLFCTADLLDELLRAPMRSSAWLLCSTVSVSLGSPQITVDPETLPQENTDSSAHVPRPPCQRGDREQWTLMELCTPTPSRAKVTSSADSR
ncbi:Meiosis Regulator And Mrna Stability Factor 1, partial [Manis pentadactyla]